MNFRPGWFIYPHTGIAIIVLSESELAEQEAVMGVGEYIREATEGELAYQTSGIHIETTDTKNMGLAS